MIPGIPDERETFCVIIALICTYYNDTSGGDSGHIEKVVQVQCGAYAHL